MASLPRYHQDMGSREHQKYWFMVAAALGALVIAMIAATASAAGPASRFAWTGVLMIIAYVAATGVVASFLCGIRGKRFPLARSIIVEIPEPEIAAEPKIADEPPKKQHLPVGSTWSEVDEALKKYKESHERQPGQ